MEMTIPRFRRRRFRFLLRVCCTAFALFGAGEQATAQRAEEILRMAGVKGGFIVHLGCGDATLTARLHRGGAFATHGLDTNGEAIEAARKRLIREGVYGPLSLDRWDGRRLPYADGSVNLIVARDPGGVSEAEMLRALAPNGVALVLREGNWRKTVKPWPEGMDEWTHYLHAADGNPVAADTLLGPPKRLRWLGSPRWSRHHDHMASMTSMVSAGGRLFYILDEGPTASIQLPSDWQLVARDAFNGVILWRRGIERWNTRQYPLKSGPAHLLRRLVAVGDRVYVTLGIDAPVVVLDAATGETIRSYEGSEFTREILVSDGVLFLVADTAPSKLPSWRRISTYTWDNTRAANRLWGWSGAARRILAYDATTGRPLWQADAPVAPCSLVVGGKGAVFHDGKKLVCLDRSNGTVRWESQPAPTAMPVQSNTGPRLLIYNRILLFAGNNGKMSGWSLADGKKLWENRHKPSGHLSLKDLFVVSGLAWTGAIAGSRNDGTFTGYDPVSGEVKREFKADVKVHWFHHRCYPAKGAGKYLLTARNGTEFIDLEKESWKPHHWLRGGCIYGVMPCNGLVYAGMDACGCQLEAKLTGLKALAPGPVVDSRQAENSPDRLETGSAYGQALGAAANAEDWPTYRHDAGRNGSASTRVRPALGRTWQAAIGGRLSPPIIAAGMLFVADIDRHSVHALDASSGESLWSRTVGGRIDSPPTYFRGLLLFGSVDGYVYALRARDGALAWRYRAAPIDRRMMVWEQLESAWPVHGSVLVHDGVLYCTAGRNMYLDGGIRFLRLDPLTGKRIGEVVMNDFDPESGQEMHLAYLKKTQGNNMPVAHSDILYCDDKYIWMRSQKIDFKGKRLEIGLKPVTEQNPDEFHIFCQNGFLDDTYFFRSYWTYGRRMTGGYGGWYQAGRLVPSGRILCVDEKRVYGYGRKPEYMVNSSVIEYQLFAADKTVTKEAIQRIQVANRKMNARLRQKNGNASDWRLRYFFKDEDLTAVRFQWQLDQPSVIVRAMAVAGDVLFVSGAPDLVDERQAYRFPDDAGIRKALVRQAAALRGGQGGALWAVSTTEGKPLARYALDTVPVFDGLAAARGKLYMSTIDGRVLCFSGQGERIPMKADERPLRVAWDGPEDANYLLPPPVPKDQDFDTVSQCSVFASELGYRLRGKGTKKVGVAVRKLAEPITGTVTFRTHLKAVPGRTGLLSNGYLAFGDGPEDARLIKCGERLRPQHAGIIQGPLLGGKAKSAPVKAPEAKGLAIVVTVDLAARKIVFLANGVTIEAPIEKPLEAITHVGYAMDNACVDFAPIQIERTKKP